MATITETVALSSANYNAWIANTTNNTNTSSISGLDDFLTKSEGAFDDNIIPPVSATVFDNTDISVSVVLQVNEKGTKGIEDFGKTGGVFIDTTAVSSVPSQVDASKIDFTTMGVAKVAKFDDWHKSIVMIDRIDFAGFAATIARNTNTYTVEGVKSFGVISDGDRDTQVNPPVSAPMFNIEMNTGATVTTQTDPKGIKAFEEYGDLNVALLGKDMNAFIESDGFVITRVHVDASKIDFTTMGVAQVAKFDDWHKTIERVNDIDNTGFGATTTNNVNTYTLHHTNDMWYKGPGSTHGLRFTSSVAQQTDFTLPVTALYIQYWS